MNKLTASLLSLGLILASCTSTPPSQDSPNSTPEPPTPTPDPMNASWDDRSVFADGLVESQRSILNELDGASVYRIELTIQDSLFEIDGKEQVHYTNTEDVSLSEVQFRLFPNILGGEMTVSNLSVDNSSVTPIYQLNNSLMIVPLAKALEPGQSITISMDFEVTVTQSLELNYGVQAFAEEVLALAHAYPVVAVYDDEGWNAELPPQAGDVTYADTAFYLVRIHAPKGLTLVTSGREISHDEDEQAQVVTVANGPARDFYLAGSFNYEITSETLGGVTIRSFAPKDSENGSKYALEVASKALDVFSKRYAQYPYTELDIIQTPTLALGIEYPGAIAITNRIYEVNGEYQGSPTRIYMESTVAHEVGHQWFYSLIGDDQLDDPWLDESLTQFATLQYYSDLYGSGGAEGFQASLEGRWQRVNNADIPVGLPVADYQGAEYGAIVYGRGPLFFVALREEMGTSPFDVFMKEYTETYAWGIATPQGLQSLAEKNCNCDLQPIFDEWVYPKE